MLIISSGMPKSGSTYMFHLLNGLAIAGGYPDSLVSRKDYDLDGTLGYPNNFIAKLPAGPLARLWRIAAREGRFLIKTHDALSPPARFAARWLGTRVVYTYRDPRDCLLSALDYGVKLRERGAGESYFGRMHTFDDAFPQVKKWIGTWRAYQATPGAFCVKYEDLLAAPDPILERCARLLKVRTDAESRAKIVWDCSAGNPEAGRLRMPINKAVANRYRTEMTAEHRARFRDELGESLTRMGYPLD